MEGQGDVVIKRKKRDTGIYTIEDLGFRVEGLGLGDLESRCEYMMRITAMILWLIVAKGTLSRPLDRTGNLCNERRTGGRHSPKAPESYE